jgi:purine-nucleoside phosphorylase
VPARLRPTAPIAADAVLVGDPGRALLLAQELLEQPKMSNHARGLWGYTGVTTASGRPLTIQSTGMGGPSAAAVLADLAELGLRRAVRVGTCSSAATEPGELLVVERALAEGGSAAAFGLSVGEAVSPDPRLAESLAAALGAAARLATIASVDSMPEPGDVAPAGAEARDMQTVAVLARAGSLGIGAAAVLIATEAAGGSRLGEKEAESAAKRAGSAAAIALSKPLA